MNTRFIKNVIYKLKKDYGVSLKYITISQSEVNFDTGQRNIIKSVCEFIAVALPKTLTRKFIQDIGYLAANKNFTYGALNDYNDIKFIIDRDDLPSELNLEIDGYVIYNGKRYEKIQFEIIEHEVAFMLSCKNREGSKAYDITKLNPQSSFQLQQGVSFELN